MPTRGLAAHMFKLGKVYHGIMLYKIVLLPTGRLGTHMFK
jgi:hypothetical protein